MPPGARRALESHLKELEAANESSQQQHGGPQLALRQQGEEHDASMLIDRLASQILYVNMQIKKVYNVYTMYILCTTV